MIIAQQSHEPARRAGTRLAHARHTPGMAHARHTPRTRPEHARLLPSTAWHTLGTHQAYIQSFIKLVNQAFTTIESHEPARRAGTRPAHARHTAYTLPAHPVAFR
jgi:hypothetical protein